MRKVLAFIPYSAKIISLIFFTVSFGVIAYTSGNNDKQVPANATTNQVAQDSTQQNVQITSAMIVDGSIHKNHLDSQLVKILSLAEQTALDHNETADKLEQYAQLVPSCTKNGYLLWNGSSWDCSEITTQIINNQPEEAVVPVSRGGLGISIDDTTASNQMIFWNGDTKQMELLALSGNIKPQGNVLSATDQYEGTVTALTFSRGLNGGTVTDTGVVTIDAPTCTDSQKLIWDGDEFLCKTDIDTDTTYSASAGLDLTSGAFSLDAPVCESDEKLAWDGTTLSCITDIIGSTAYTAGDGLQLAAGEFSISASTCTGNDKLIWNGTAFACSADIDTDTDTTYTAGNGLDLSSTTFSIDATACAIEEKLTWSGTAFVCSTDIDTDTDTDTTYAAGDGLSLSGTTFVIDSSTCTGTDKLTWNGSAFICSTDTDTDTDTTYTAGNGIDLTSTTFSIDATTCTGDDKLTWSGTAFVCSTDTDTDTDTTYTAGNGLGLSSTTFSINASACTGDDKLTWSGTAFVCSADVDTDTDTTYTAGSGLNLTDTTFALNAPTCTGTDKLSWNGTGLFCTTDVDTDTDSTYVAGNGLNLVDDMFEVNAPACIGSEKLTWDGATFYCMPDITGSTAYTAGNDLDLTSTVFSLETQLDTVNVISLDSADLTIQTLTSGNIILNPAGGVGIGSAVSGIELNVAGDFRTSTFQLGTSATSGNVLTTNSSGVGTWQELPVGSVYQTTTSKTGVIIWNGSATTTSGVATLNLTDDGTGSGNALFTNIYSVVATGAKDTSSVDSVPLASVKSISVDKKTVTVNVLDSRTISVLGSAGLEFSADGTVVYVSVFGD